MRIRGEIGRYDKRLRTSWKKVGEFVYQSVGVCVGLWRSVEVCKGLWRFMEVYERFIEVFEDLWKSVESCKGL